MLTACTTTSLQQSYDDKRPVDLLDPSDPSSSCNPFSWETTTIMCEFFTYDKWQYVNNTLTWFLCPYNIQQHINCYSSFSIHFLEQLMQANPPHSLYILYTNRENVLFCVQYISYLKFCILILWINWCVGAIV